MINNKLFSNTTLIYSNFDYKNVQDFPGFGVDWTANLREFSGKIDFEYYLNPKSTLYFGFHNSFRTFRPGNFEPTNEESIFEATGLDKQYALDNALYLSNRLHLSDRLSLEYGLRLSRFAQLGEARVFTYSEAETPELKVNSQITDTTYYDNGEEVVSFLNPEPRFSARYKMGPSSSVKFSYNRMLQYVHQMVTGTSPLPIAVWQPSTTHIDPQIADQIAAGYFKNFKKNTYETSFEVYYKWMDNIVDFRDNAQVFFNENLPLELLPGKSTAYGAEFLVRKSKGKLTGWLSYTWSKTTREIPGINNGKAFPASYDRRHNATLVATYDLNDRFSLGSSWIFGTGRGLTLPSGKYRFQGQVVDLYTGRNEYRMPPFHRLDLSLTWYSKDKPGRWWLSETNFSIYNFYGRQNPYIIFTQPPEEGSDNAILINYDENGNIVTGREITQVNLFGILPSISYTFKF
ncbi:MAG: TonB-dependent receptor plug domain-containing protein [Cyclobacteriaceae bacterium]